jgi:hypothetical protein
MADGIFVREVNFGENDSVVVCSDKVDEILKNEEIGIETAVTSFKLRRILVVKGDWRDTVSMLKGKYDLVTVNGVEVKL